MSKAPDLGSGNLAEVGRRIREFVYGGCRVVFTAHAETRMAERGVTREDVYLVLTSGAATASELHGTEWRTKMQTIVDARLVGVVVTLTRREDGLVVVTVIA